MVVVVVVVLVVVVVVARSPSSPRSSDLEARSSIEGSRDPRSSDLRGVAPRTSESSSLGSGLEPGSSIVEPRWKLDPRAAARGRKILGPRARVRGPWIPRASDRGWSLVVVVLVVVVVVHLPPLAPLPSPPLAPLPRTTRTGLEPRGGASRLQDPRDSARTFDRRLADPRASESSSFGSRLEPGIVARPATAAAPSPILGPRTQGPRIFDLGSKSVVRRILGPRASNGGWSLDGDGLHLDGARAR